MTPTDKPLDLEHLKRLCEAATPEPRVAVHGTNNGWEVGRPHGHRVAIENWHGAPEHQDYKEQYAADGHFIAAALLREREAGKAGR